MLTGRQGNLVARFFPGAGCQLMANFPGAGVTPTAVRQNARGCGGNSMSETPQTA
jgi:hypothetical protein